MELSKTQLMLLRLCNADGIFYPHYRQYLDGELVYIRGSGIATSILSIISNGLGKALPELNPYAFEITDKGREAVDNALRRRGTPPSAKAGGLRARSRKVV